jgi:anti-sigma regulatory factor (Ser/Thr protein kinase)
MMLEQEDLDRAFNKELFIIRNDIYYQQLEFKNKAAKSILRVDISYKPQQALSGDSYSLRKTKDGRIVGFIVDAMGKGISAALTSMGATRFLNYIFDELEENRSFDFQLWTQKFVRFMTQNLMDEEMLSIALMELNFHQSTTQYALCGMPAFLVATDDSEFTLIKSNNPPMMRYTTSLKISSAPTSNIRKILCYTDGLSESITREGIPYNMQMRQDFFDSACVGEFNDLVKKAIVKGDDDITYFYIHKSECGFDRKQLCIQSSYKAVEETLQEISTYLNNQQVNRKCASEIILAFSELLLNALEHGNFGISREAKNELIAKDLFDDTMIRLEARYKEKPIKITYRMMQRKRGKIFEATIADSGDGFDVQVLKNIVVNAANFNGRGFIIVRKLVDRFYFNVKGNAITIQKLLIFDSKL